MWPLRPIRQLSYHRIRLPAVSSLLLLVRLMFLSVSPAASVYRAVCLSVGRSVGVCEFKMAARSKRPLGFCCWLLP